MKHNKMTDYLIKSLKIIVEIIYTVKNNDTLYYIKRKCEVNSSSGAIG